MLISDWSSDVCASDLSAYLDDIKYGGPLAHLNPPIDIGGVRVLNDDYVFADADGVVVIPQDKWAEVEERAWDVLANEAKIRLYAARGRDVGEIIEECGAF